MTKRKAPKGKGTAKPRGKTKPPKAKAPPRNARMGNPPIEAEDLFAGAPLAPKFNKQGRCRKCGHGPEECFCGEKAPPAALLPRSDLEAIRAEHAERIEREDEEEALRSRSGEAPPRPLNPRQRLFAEHYAKLGNATQAYKLAGYTGTTEESYQNAASRLLGHVGVRKYIGELLDDAAAPRIADAAERHQFLTSVMRGEIKSKSHFYGVEHETAPAMAERIKAAELLSKINGEMTEKKQIEGEVVIRVVRGNHAPSAIGSTAVDDD